MQHSVFACATQLHILATFLNTSTTDVGIYIQNTLKIVPIKMFDGSEGRGLEPREI
jgi:hypothetical protein